MVQAATGLLKLYDDNLVKIHLLGETIPRPFKAPDSPFAALLGGGAGADATPAAVEGEGEAAAEDVAAVEGDASSTTTDAAASSEGTSDVRKRAAKKE